MHNMAIKPLSIDEKYWDNLTIQESDLEIIYNHLLEIETPQDSQELISVLIDERIKQEKKALESDKLAGSIIYLPKNHYQAGQQLVFPILNWEKGNVTNSREGHNPDLGPFEVIEVVLASGEKHFFAAGVAEHVLNQPVTINLSDPNLDNKYVKNKFSDQLASQLTTRLENNPDLVCIAGKWFPKALLVDVNVGYLNLAEALLEMESGKPLTTKTILEQIELPTDVNSKLTEFSLNLALQLDERFDEVGPAGEILWFLKRLEPEWVQEIPLYLKFSSITYDQTRVADMVNVIENEVQDELEIKEPAARDGNEAIISLIFPHLRCGTLPLTSQIRRLFPTAYEAPRVLFTFVDGDSGQKFYGWVVRSSRYVFGLRDWYTAQGLVPGSLVHIIRSKNRGEVIIKAEKKRAAREWIRTALIGADGGIVFANLKQLVSANYNERMAIVIPDLQALEKIWEQSNRQRGTLEQVVLTMMKELTKLSPQGHVHAQELYAAVNMVRRCPPGPILSILVEQSWAKHLGDLYFRLDESFQEEQKQ
jgi:hypothetical protein